MKNETKLMGMLAYASLVISALVSITLFILSKFEEYKDLSKFQFVANLLLVLVVVWLAWQYAKTLKRFGRGVFLIVAILAILSVIGINFI